MGDLTEYRNRIDAIDRKITALFEERMDVVLDVARYKLAHNLEVFQGTRERCVQETGVEVNPVVGKELIILGLVGDTSKIDPSRIEANRNVERLSLIHI